MTRKLRAGVVRDLRDVQGWTLRGFARQLGISSGHLHAIEAGTKEPRPALRNRICAELQVPLEELTHQVVVETGSQDDDHPASAGAA